MLSAGGVSPDSCPCMDLPLSCPLSLMASCLAVLQVDICLWFLLLWQSVGCPTLASVWGFVQRYNPLLNGTSHDMIS